MKVSPEFERLLQRHIHGEELYGHAQSTVDHVIVAGLGAKCLVGHLEARRAVHRSVNPRYLRNPNQSQRRAWDQATQ